MSMLQRVGQQAGRLAQQTSLTSLKQWSEGLQQPAAALAEKMPSWIMLGPPGVGKGTYSSRVAKLLGISHISAGDLVRDEIKNQTECGQQVARLVNQGDLLPDSIILQLLQQRLAAGRARGEGGVLLDGFPRTRSQAETLLRFSDVQLALNLHLREEVLIEKCLGRRLCSCCGKSFNVADINLPASASGEPAITMPPLNPPASCVPYLEMRSDDNYATIKRRLKVYNSEAAPVEQLFRDAGLLLDFEITGGIPETLPRLVDALRPHSAHLEEKQAA